MTYFAAFVGTDGAGKSTTAKSVVSQLAAHTGRRVGYAGDTYIAVSPQADLLKGALRTRGKPWWVRVALGLRRLAKKTVNLRALYPLIKVLHLIVQERAARAMARRYRLDIVLLDTSALISCIGRIRNYTSKDTAPEQMIRQLVEGRAPAPSAHGAGLALTRIAAAFRRMGVDLFPVPSAVILLDLEPREALARLNRRETTPLDRHENLEDLARSRSDHVATVHALLRVVPGLRTARIDVGSQTAIETAEHASTTLARWLSGDAAGGDVSSFDAGYGAGATRRALTGAIGRFVQLRYLAAGFRHIRQDSWREALFVLSRPGRRLAREGYSADVMHAIYRPSARPNWAERCFLQYPLHRAVKARLGLVQDRIRFALESIVDRRSERDRATPIRILSAPSGTAEDILGFLELHPWRKTPLELVFADLDPSRELALSIRRRAAALGISARFVRGDLTAPSTQARIRAGRCFDLVLFIGLSSWLTKPQLTAYQAFVADVLNPLGSVISDCFTPAAYAQSGHCMGFRAQYYEPEAYRLAWRRVGLDLVSPTPWQGVLSGPHRINHVLTLRPVRRAPIRAKPRTAA